MKYQGRDVQSGFGQAELPLGVIWVYQGMRREWCFLPTGAGAADSALETGM